MNTKVSVIMGIFNCSDTLAEAINSLLSQTFSDWKLIMCDDGSSDDTYMIAKKYVNQYPEKIILLRNKRNVGLNKTLNNCLKIADSQYIARMDGDDISLPERFEKEVCFLDSHPEYAIVSTPMIHFDEKGDYRIGLGYGEPDLKLFSKCPPFCHATCMVRREAYSAVNGYSEDKKRLRVEDWDLWIRMYEKGFKGFVLSDSLYKMRDDRNAYSRRKFRYRINEARVVMSAVQKLKLNPINYIYVLRPILVGMLPYKIYHYLHKKRV